LFPLVGRDAIIKFYQDMPITPLEIPVHAKPIRLITGIAPQDFDVYPSSQVTEITFDSLTCPAKHAGMSSEL